MDVFLVRDFNIVFPKDLLGLSLDREIDFSIDLSLGTKSISRTSYKIAPMDLKELKEILQKLLDKGFIYLSISP